MNKQFSNSSTDSNFSGISNISNNSFSSSINSFPSFLGIITFYFSQTYLSEYFEKKENFIKNHYDKKNDQYEGFYLFLDALKIIKNKKIQDFKNKINKLEAYKDKKGNKIQNEKINKTSLEKINFFIFNDIIFENIKILVGKEKNKERIHSPEIESRGKGKTLEQAIKQYEEGIKNVLEEIKNFSDLFLTKEIKNDSDSGGYKIAKRFYFVINMNDIPKDLNINTIEYYLEKQKKKIYSYPNILIFLFISSNNIDYKIKYEKEMTLKLYNGNEQKFLFNSIIFEDREDNEYKIVVKNNNNNNKSIFFDNHKIEENYFFDESNNEKKGNIVMLIYKKN